MEAGSVPAAAAPGGVQPEQGQGADGSVQNENAGNPFFDLDSAPPEIRPHLAPYLKEMEGNATKKFQEHAEQMRRYEALKELPDEDLAALRQFYDLANDDEQFTPWLERMAREYGLISDEAEVDDEDEFDDDEDVDLDADTIAEVVRTIIDERLTPYEEDRQKEAEQRAINQANEHIANEFAALEEEHGAFDKDAVMSLALRYGDDPECIRKGHADYMRIAGGAQRELVEGTRQQPGAALSSGQTPDTFKPPTSFKDARKMASERMAAEV